MFCPNCGTNLPEGTQVCTNCGNPMQQPQYQQPQYQPPQYQPPQYQPPQYQQPQYQQPQYRPEPAVDRDAMSKREFISHTTNKNVKRNALVVTVTMLLCLVLIGGGIFATLSMPFYEIPVLGGILDLAGADTHELTRELSRELGYLQAQYEFAKASLGETEREAVETLMEKAENLVENFSILNFKAYMGVMEEYSGKLGYSAGMEGFEEVQTILDVAVGVLVGCFFLPLLFTLLGGLLKSTGLTITALVFTAISLAMFSGWIWVLACLVAYIVQAVFCSKITKDYRDFTLGLAPL